MGKNSKIEWCDHTFNPWIGCSRVSAGCDNCYAEAMRAKRLKQVEWGPHGIRIRTSENNWRQPLKWNKAATATGERPRVFCASLADIFDNHRSIDPSWRDELWALIRSTPNLDWLILTKRPQNFKKYLPRDWGHGYPNVWLGVTVEDQEEADRRIPHLIEASAQLRFLSCEPLIGGVDLTWIGHSLDLDGVIDCLIGRTWIAPAPDGRSHTTYRYGQEFVRRELRDYIEKIDWVIIGGETGANARPCVKSSIISLINQCQNADIPIFLKQLGSKYEDAQNHVCGAGVKWPYDVLPNGPSFRLKDKKGADPSEWPSSLQSPLLRRFPKICG